MTMLSLSPMEWADLRDIDDVEPIGQHDNECLAELRDVLKKFGYMERFGITLLHRHFDVANDEIMLETVDEESRTLTTTAVKEAEVGQNRIATMLMLRDGDVETMSWCRKYCERWAFGHSKAHNRAR